MRFFRTGVAALACTALLAACGGEDDSLPQTEVVTPSTTETEVSDEPITTDDFLAAGDEICVETFSAISAAEEDETDDAELYETRANLYEEMLEELQSLGTPEDEEGLEDLYSAATDLAETNNDAAAAAEDGDDATLTPPTPRLRPPSQPSRQPPSPSASRTAATPPPGSPSTPATPRAPCPAHHAGPDRARARRARAGARRARTRARARPGSGPRADPPADSGGAAPAAPAPEPEPAPAPSSGGGIGPG